MINIELSDGSVIQDLEVNGNCLISENNIKNELLTDDMLSEIVIDGVTYKNITLVRKWVQDDKTWLAFRQKTEDEIWKEQCKSNLDYIAMMSNVDLEE